MGGPRQFSTLRPIRTSPTEIIGISGEAWIDIVLRFQDIHRQ
jgi:hypothetical protein